MIPLTKHETTIGRPGVQVAKLLRAERGFAVKPLEGEKPPLVNGRPIPMDGVLLVDNDVIEMAGTRLQLVLSDDGGAKA